jgi:hypothetical protein
VTSGLAVPSSLVAGRSVQWSAQREEAPGEFGHDSVRFSLTCVQLSDQRWRAEVREREGVAGEGATAAAALAAAKGAVLRALAAEIDAGQGEELGQVRFVEESEDADPEPVMAPLKWLETAEDDLAAAKALSQRRLVGPAIFHLQQTAEKGLKALVLAVAGEVERPIDVRRFQHSASLLLRATMGWVHDAEVDAARAAVDAGEPFDGPRRAMRQSMRAFDREHQRRTRASLSSSEIRDLLRRARAEIAQFSNPTDEQVREFARDAAIAGREKATRKGEPVPAPLTLEQARQAMGNPHTAIALALLDASVAATQTTAEASRYGAGDASPREVFGEKHPLVECFGMLVRALEEALAALRRVLE